MNNETRFWNFQEQTKHGFSDSGWIWAMWRSGLILEMSRNVLDTSKLIENGWSYDHQLLACHGFFELQQGFLSQIFYPNSCGMHHVYIVEGFEVILRKNQSIINANQIWFCIKSNFHILINFQSNLAISIQILKFAGFIELLGCQGREKNQLAINFWFYTLFLNLICI